MKPLEKNYKTFTLLGICPPAKSISFWMKLQIVIVSILCPTVECIALISSSVFVSNSFSNDLSNAICATFQIAAVVAALNALIMAYIKRNDLHEIFVDFQIFYDARK